jgi:hypothetical protein
MANLVVIISFIILCSKRQKIKQRLSLWEKVFPTGKSIDELLKNNNAHMTISTPEGEVVDSENYSIDKFVRGKKDKLKKSIEDSK